MLFLFETAAGFALFKLNKKLKKIEDPVAEFENVNKAMKLVSLEQFSKFKDTRDALECANKLIKGKLPKKLSKMLKKNIISQEIQENLAVNDKRLAKTINEKLGIVCQSGKDVLPVFRGIRLQLEHLVAGLDEKEVSRMSLGLAHGLSRYKLKLSVDKVDTMIIQAISLLDDLEKEINNYMMRLREWYGWHFPELSKVVTDNLVYAQVVQKTGIRSKFHDIDLSGVVPEEVEKEVKEAAEISMGTEINEQDEMFILNLATQIVELSEYKTSLSEYLSNRMNAIAPNLTNMIGETVGARLISHAGSLVNLAKHPASTLQILGAEKALFKAIRTKKKTPKYGLIYNASLVGQASAKIKGKVSRTLASKCSLCVRVDALGENPDGEMGLEQKEYVTKRINYLEQGRGEGFDKAKPTQHRAFNGGNQREGGYNAGGDMQFV